MPRTILALILGIATLAVTATAAPKDKPTVKIGLLVCAKCTLGEDTGCRHAMKVTEGTEEVIYYVNDKGGRETYHRKICDAGNELKVKVTGTLVEKKGKKFLDYPKVEFIK
ncbi:MAG: hypothetical protein LC104_11015 [Bacteroidales bacterium]|nr:hypothetical protein [Bacteroidales bacterium]